MGTGLTSTEWNRDVLQQGNYTQEVLAGSNADKLPNNAFAANTIDAANLVDNTVLNAKLATGIDGAKLNNASVDGTKLAVITNHPGRMVFGDGGLNGNHFPRATFCTIAGFTYLTNNVYFDGTNWQRYNTAYPAWALQLGTGNGGAGDQFNVMRWPAGGNPATTSTSPLFVDAVGKLAGAGLYRSGEVAITTGSSATFAHGFGVRPSIVDGWFGTISGTHTRSLYRVGIVGAPPASVYLANADATNVTVGNTSGATAYVDVTAVL